MDAHLEGQVLTMLIERRGDRTCLIVPHHSSVCVQVNHLLALAHGELNWSQFGESGSVKQVLALTRGGGISIRFLRKHGSWSLAVLEQLKSEECSW